MHFGLIVTPAPGHLFPICAIGRELLRRGHQVTLLTAEDMVPFANNQGISARAMYPKGAMYAYRERVKTLGAIAAVRAGIGFHADFMQAMARESLVGFDALVVDEFQFQGGAMAERAGLPFVGVGTALSFLPMPRSKTPECLRRGNAITTWLAGAMFRRETRAWPQPIYSPRAHIFTFPRSLSDNVFPARFHFVGGVADERPAPEFPWQRLDGRPLVYAAFGTTLPLATRERLFAKVALACAALPVQLVIGMGLPREGRALPRYPGEPIVVEYAPQVDLCKRAAVVVCHAGMNTISEALTHGAPLVVLPKPDVAVASNVKRAGVGVIAAPNWIRRSIARVLATPNYRARAAELAREIAAAGGVARAADLIVDACATPAPPR